MSLQRLDILIREARARTGNQTYADGQGIQQRDFVSFANDAAARLHNVMMLKRPSLYVKEGFLNVTANTASITLPTDVHIKHNILKVDYSHDGTARNYAPLELRTPRQEVSSTGYPQSYFLRDGSLILSPIPQTSVTNGIRLNYQYVVPRLDIRRGKISSVNTGAGTIVLEDDATLLDESESDLTNNWVDYICIVDKDGAQIDTDRAFSSYNSTTRTITCTALTGSAAAAGQYVVFGKNTTTHSTLPDRAHSYIVEYMCLRSQMAGTSPESVITSPVLSTIEEEILDSIEQLEEDISAIPVIDPDFLTYADEL